MLTTADIEAMTGKSAALLTQTQRTRIQSDFDELAEDEKRRDQQRIRERIRSGILDFHLLTEYPDRQFTLAFDDVPDDELRAALADNYLVVERLRELHGYNRAALIEEARNRPTDASETTAAVPSLDRLDLQTAAEIRRQTETDVEERFEAGRWDVRARRLGKLGALAFIPPALYLLYGIFSTVLPVPPPPAPSLMGRLIGPLWILGFGGFFGWALIMAAKAVKYELLPTVGKLVNHPDKVVREIFEKLIKHPRETVRESWNEL
jgi:hypothetical protein